MVPRGTSQKGLFVALKAPLGTSQNFVWVSDVPFTFPTIAPAIWESFIKVKWMGQKTWA